MAEGERKKKQKEAGNCFYRHLVAVLQCTIALFAAASLSPNNFFFSFYINLNKWGQNVDSGRDCSLMYSGSLARPTLLPGFSTATWVVVFGTVAWTTGVTHIPPLIHSGIVSGGMGVDLMGLVGG